MIMEFPMSRAFDSRILIGKKFKKELNLKCGYCGGNLEVYVLRRKKDNSLILNKGKVEQNEDKTKLTVKCRFCQTKTIFETQSPILERDGWETKRYIKGVRPKVKVKKTRKRSKHVMISDVHLSMK